MTAAVVHTATTGSPDMPNAVGTGTGAADVFGNGTGDADSGVPDTGDGWGDGMRGYGTGAGGGRGGSSNDTAYHNGEQLS